MLGYIIVSAHSIGISDILLVGYLWQAEMPKYSLFVLQIRHVLFLLLCKCIEPAEFKTFMQTTKRIWRVLKQE